MGTRQEMRRSAEIRASARMAVFKLAEKTRYQRAERAATVTQPEFKAGDMCFVLRRNTLSRQWCECPGVVVQVLGATAWVAIRRELLKGSKLALLKATSEDQKGGEAVKEHMTDLQQELSPHRRVRDITNKVPRNLGTETTRNSSTRNFCTDAENSRNTENTRYTEEYTSAISITDSVRIQGQTSGTSRKTRR
eukprot:5111116-Amphidinium_carterae.7